MLMIKYILYILNFISFYILFLFQDPVSINIKAPEEAKAGSSIIVEVTINKFDINGFARFQQNLPVGYTAEPVHIPTGDFTFKDQRIIVGWLNLPKDNVISFSYKINIDNTAEGPLLLSGIFSYIENNERKNVEAPTVSVIIRPAEFVAYDNNQQLTPISDSMNKVKTQEDYHLENVFCYRQITRENNDFVVNLLVNTANLPRDKFAKIQEIIPAEYTATEIETNEGIFSFKNNNVKFLWMSLPSQKQFIVSYKLTSNTGTSEIPNITGSFSYIENESTKIKSIQNKDFLESPLMAFVNEQKQNKENKTIISNEQFEQNDNKIIVEAPETGIRYRVQISASHRMVNTKHYFKRFKIYESVKVELHEGWHKYTIGSFTLYKEARDKRVQVWENTPIHDAFVSAYNNGVRITVQEALMITHQKWVQ